MSYAKDPVLREVEVARKALAPVIDDWTSRSGVTAIDIGPRLAGGSETNQTAIRVYVAEKKSPSDINSGEIFPDELDGVDVDVVEAVGLGPEFRKGRFEAIPLGVSVGSHESTAGSLGALVIDEETGQEMILSARSVFQGAAGAPIFQPGRIDGGEDDDAIAELARWVFYEEEAPFEAAVARLTGGRVLGNTLEGHEIRGVIEPRLGMRVWKSGRGSGYTMGVVNLVSASTVVHGYGGEPRTLKGAIRISPLPGAEEQRTSAAGDMGAVWVDAESGRAVAMHLVGATQGPPWFSIAAPVSAITAALGVRFPDQRPEQIEVNFALNDRPVGKDELGYDDYAEAFARVLSNIQTRTPLTVGLYASWGMGKSFLMHLVQQRMAAVQERQEAHRKQRPRLVRLRAWFRQFLPVRTEETPESSAFFHRLRDRFRRPPPTTVDFHFIYFNAWVYSGSDNLWAGLITHLYDEVGKYLKWRAAYFRLGSSFRSSLGRTAGLLLFYGLLALVASLLIDFDRIQEAWTGLKAATLALLGGSALAALPALFRALNDLGSSVVLSRAKQLERLTSRPDFQEQLGFMADIKREVGIVSKLLNRGKNGRPTRLVIFIDDLDRCPPRRAVEVLQAIMLLLADDDGAPYIVFLGLDARIVVSSIEEWYGKVLVEAGITGYEYLDKIVQIPFTIPASGETARRRFVTSLLARPEAGQADGGDKSQDGGDEPGAVVETTDVETAVAGAAGVEGVDQPAAGDEAAESGATGRDEATGAPPLSSLAGVIGLAQERETPAVGKKERPPLEISFRPEELQAFQDYAAFLSPNPRRMKRIINIYSVVRQLAANAGDEQRQLLIKWIILSEQWPFRTAWIMQKVEDDYQTGGDFQRNPVAPLKEIYSAVKARVEAKETRKLSTMDGDHELFENFIGDEPFILAADVHALHRLTFNLNPAMQEALLKAAG